MAWIKNIETGPGFFENEFSAFINGQMTFVAGKHRLREDGRVWGDVIIVEEQNNRALVRFMVQDGCQTYIPLDDIEFVERKFLI